MTLIARFPSSNNDDGKNNDGKENNLQKGRGGKNLRQRINNAKLKVDKGSRTSTIAPEPSEAPSQQLSSQSIVRTKGTV